MDSRRFLPLVACRYSVLRSTRLRIGRSYARQSVDARAWSQFRVEQRLGAFPPSGDGSYLVFRWICTAEVLLGLLPNP